MQSVWIDCLAKGSYQVFVLNLAQDSLPFCQIKAKLIINLLVDLLDKTQSV